MAQGVEANAGGATPTRTRLVSFVGTGRYDKATRTYHYDRVRHRFPDGRAGVETPYICRALADHVAADEIEIVVTAEAEQAHRAKLVAELCKANLPAPTFHPIPKGESEAELWRQFEVVKCLLRPPAGTRIVFDITHAFRSQPFFAAAITSFVRSVDSSPAPIQVFYAAFEARQEGFTPVWNLTPFIDVADWTQDMIMFLRTGRSANVAGRTERLSRELKRGWADKKEGNPPNLDKLAGALRDFGGNLETVRTGDLLLPGFRGSAERLAVALEETRQSAAAIPPLADVLDRVRCDMVEPLLGASDHLASDAGHRALVGLARLYLEMGRWPEAAAIVREGWITRYAVPAAALGERNQQRPSVDKAARDSAEARWHDQEWDAMRRIAAIRNDIEHAGFNRQPAAAGNLQRDLHRLVDEFSKLPALAAPAKVGAHAPVFVNLSNHPSERWSEPQREAASRFAPDIRDWPFPPVPPEAEPAEIAELAERTVEDLTVAFPGITHAMVQGEFTLVHALVRKLQQRGIVCLSATTRRDVIEEGADVKTTRFVFVRFREYP
jgi:CRISPR-associated protein Csx16